MSSAQSFILPCYVWLGNKRISLTMNWYRNAWHHQSNKVKQSYMPTPAKPQIKAKSVAIKYHLVLASNARTDMMNWVSVADKFFCDWLVHQGVIPDDSFRQIGSYDISCEVDKAAKENYILATVKVLEPV